MRVSVAVTFWHLMTWDIVLSSKLQSGHSGVCESPMTNFRALVGAHLKMNLRHVARLLQERH